MHFDNIQTIKEAVALVRARAFCGAHDACGNRARPPGSRAARSSRPQTPVGILHRRRKKLHPAAQAFLELLTKSHAAGVQGAKALCGAGNSAAAAFSGGSFAPK